MWDSLAPLLEVDRVTKVFGGGLFSKRRTLALEDFSLTVPSGRPTIIAIAGESGSGKTTLARLILGFLTPTSGTIRYRGKDIWHLTPQERWQYRREVQAIFQDPYEVFNPFYRVDHVLKTVVDKFGLAQQSGVTARQVIEEALEAVGLRPSETLGKYPHQLSGGQRQRIMVARALLLKPRLIVADEPVSMVDASLRAMILDVMIRLKDEHGITFLYITHDLSTAFQIADEIYILYRGALVEYGSATTVIQNPAHPYTRLLVSSIPVPDPSMRWRDRIEIPVDEESTGMLTGCKFRLRCPYAMAVCAERFPAMYQTGDEQYAACYLYDPAHAPAAMPGTTPR
ncbi:MAG: ABC transporter ATP-binding protein [Chloroflexota bacterium]